MSLLPILFNDVWDDYRRPFRGDIYDQNFGMGLLNEEIQRAKDALLAVPLRSRYFRPWRSLSVEDSGVSALHSDRSEFRVNLDVQQFKPEELNVKIADGFIVVNGKHEERTDQHGYISRQFTRRYKVPEEVDTNAFVSNLSSDGVLSIFAPKKTIKDGVDRVIPITQTNTPAIKKTDEKVIEVSKQE
ncbi:protein lethal(2)essential for life-like [Rhodnius prolixus]|uniref:SHSP domain-containing protein n=2 Tax=Rhodnius TaxID=13248 RepID=T1HKE2_RHOPR